MSTMDYGEVTLALSCTYNLIWSDKGSGASVNGAMWAVVPPSGFRSLGSFGTPNHDSPPEAQLVFKASSSANPDKPPLKAPTDYTWLYDDTHTNADMSCTIWAPVPPSGYKACEVVGTNANGLKPSVDEVWCVREDLVRAGIAGDLIWSDEIFTPQINIITDFTNVLLAASTFLLVPNRTPSVTAECNVLYLKAPKEHLDGDTAPPSLDGPTEPPAETGPTTTDSIFVPCNILVDTAYSPSWQVANSPFYRLRLENNYQQLLYLDNSTSSTQQTVSNTFEFGTSSESSETFSSETGVSVGYEGGISMFGRAEAKISANFSETFGYSSTTSVTEFQSTSLQRTLSVPAGQYGCLWTVHSALALMRADNSQVGTIAYNPNTTAVVISTWDPNAK